MSSEQQVISQQEDTASQTGFLGRQGRLSQCLGLILLIISIFTVFNGYDQPSKLFWDENYHISSAQKYQAGIFFMEPHPPLGKLLIALGEELLDANEDDHVFLDTDYGKDLPDDFNFAGYRFFPTLLGTLCPLLLFLLLKRHVPVWGAFLFGFFMATENAFLVQARSAMLESTQLFFILCFLISCSCLFTAKTAGRSRLTWLLLSGLSLAAVMGTKVNGIVLFIPAALLLLTGPKKISSIGFFSVAFMTCYLLIWSIHTGIATEVNNKLPDAGFYKASEAYKADLLSHGEISAGFFRKVYDHLMFLPHYTKGVPELNFCKPEENGSPWYWWPVGGKSIRYRYDSNGDFTKYLYLAVNPVGWLLSFAGVLIGLSLSFSGLISKLEISSVKLNIIRTFAFTWIAYIGMAAMSGRVLYLYHYFIPLIFGWIMLALTLSEVRQIAGFYLPKVLKASMLAAVIFLQSFTFYYFAPLTYYLPLTEKQIMSRNWLSLWNIVCVNCKSSNPVAVSTVDPKITNSPDVYISGIRALESYQEWGVAKMNQSVTGKPLTVSGKTYSYGLGVHARSKLIFNVKSGIKGFKAMVAMPDYLISENKGSVVFSVSTESQQLWTSEVIKPGMEPVSITLPMNNPSRIILEVFDSGDNNNSDHAVWLEPEFLFGN